MPMIDAADRALKVPPKYIPYMEKFHIYQLLHELACELVIKRPDDHVKFVYDVLTHAAHTVNTRRIIIYGPPFLSKDEIINKLVEQIPKLLILPSDCMFKINKCKETPPEISTPKTRAKRIKKYIAKHHDDCANGWILRDYPRTYEDAIAMQRIGILPTHVFQLVPAFTSPISPLDSNNIPQEWVQYRRNLVYLRRVYAKRWKEVSLCQRDVPKVVDMLVKLTINNKHCGGPMVPRLCLMGPPGSGYKTVAQIVAEKLHIVNIDYQAYFMAYMLEPDDEEYKELYDSSVDPTKRSRMHSEILFRKLLESNCVNFGWILTGYPMALLDLKRLDKMATPPNKVVFLNCSDEVCKFRLENRQMNVFTGSVTNVLQEPMYAATHTLKLHPKDVPSNIEKNIKNYRMVEASLKEYCGKTATYVNAEADLASIVENVYGAIINQGPDEPPRDPYEPFENIDMTIPKSDECIYRIRTKYSEPPWVPPCDSEYRGEKPEPIDYCAELKKKQALCPLRDTIDDTDVHYIRDVL